MNPSKETLEKRLAELETLPGLCELDIETEVRKLNDREWEEEPCQEWIYETMAFSFREIYTDEERIWGTFFGPMMIWETDDGKVVESPSIKCVDEKAISYWDQRSKSVTNPIFQARYAGLVWDLSKKVIGNKPDHHSAVRCCEAIIRIADENCHKYQTAIIQKLDRALSLAISLNDKQLIEKVKKAILNFEDVVSDITKPGLWGFAFDYLVENKNVQLSDKEKKGIINSLEDKLQRLKDGSPWICESTALRLARYYRKSGLEEECSRVINVLGNAFEAAAKNADPLIASSLLDHVYHIYIQFSHSADAERVSRSIRDIGPKVINEMKLKSHKIDIPRDEFDAYVEQMVEGDLVQAFKRIVLRDIPSRDEIENQLRDLARKAPINFLMTKKLMDHQGRVVAEVGSLEDDLDGNVVAQMSQNMRISAVFLNAILDRAIQKYSLNDEKIIDYLYQAPIFTPNQVNLLKMGIQAYFKQEYIISAHLLIPQIEATIRNLVEMTGGVVMKQGRGGGFHLITLDDLLRSEQMTQSFGDDVSFYFRVVLTDQRGWNIRNNVCHGISRYDDISKPVVDRLIHILLILAQIREKAPEND